MPPERAPPGEAPLLSHTMVGSARGLAQSWPAALTRLALAALALIAVTWREWGEMFHQWWNIDTYHHVLLVPLIIIWLVTLKRETVLAVKPQSWWAGVGLVGAALVLWLAGRISEINLLAHLGAVAALVGSVAAVLGLNAALLLALPLGYAIFLVPFGDEIIPPLQSVTAEIAIALTRASGVPARIEGIHIDTPAGLFVVAEACAGVKFLIAMVALGVLVAFTRFASWRRRAWFLAACVVVPILANGVRAWGTIYAAQWVGAEAATGLDHLIYGWVFFALVVAALLGGAWRFLEREPESYGPQLTDLKRIPMRPAPAHPALVLAAITAMAMAAFAAALAA